MVDVVLLAITQYGSWILLLAIVVWVLLTSHAAFARWPNDRLHGVQPRLLTLVFLVPLVFSANWVWLSSALPLLAWWMWIGDNEHWFNGWSKSVAGVLSGIVSLIVSLRVLTRCARSNYARIQFAGAAGLLVLFGLGAVCEFIVPIKGTNPEGAVRSVLREMDPLLAATAKLDEDGRTPTCITYLVSDQNRPRARITVCRHGWWWWRIGGTNVFQDPYGGSNFAGHVD